MEKMIIGKMIAVAPYIIWGYTFFVVFFLIRYKKWGIRSPLLFAVVWVFSAPVFYYIVFECSLKKNKEHLRRLIEQTPVKQAPARHKKIKREKPQVKKVENNPEEEVNPEEVDHLFG